MVTCLFCEREVTEYVPSVLGPACIECQVYLRALQGKLGRDTRVMIVADDAPIHRPAKGVN